MREKSNDDKWIGQKFGRLTVIGFTYSSDRHKWAWVCRCDCGTEITAWPYLIKNGHTSSCGCLQKDRARAGNTIHGKTYTRLYSIYNGMKSRCFNSNQEAYKDYGGRGITICEEWLSSFESFYDWAITHGYQDGLSIDRIDNDGNYEPSNCRWATRPAQQRNTSRTNLITIDGRSQSLTDWAKERGLNYHTVSYRIHQKGMSPEQALGFEVK